MAIGLFYGKDRINSSGINFNEWKANTNYKINQYVTHNYCLFKSLAEHTSSNDFENDLSNWELVIGGNSFKLIKWLDNTEYKIDDYVVYDYKIYKCLIAHTSSTDFENDLKLGNWKLYVGNDGLEFRIWTSGENYLKDEYVVFDYKLYKTNVDINGDIDFDETKYDLIIGSEGKKYEEEFQDLDVWSVQHNLNEQYPEKIYVFDDGGNEIVLPEIKYDSMNLLTITFDFPVSGKVIVIK